MLIHVATGAGKPFAAFAFAYRLIKHAKAARIPFLTSNDVLYKAANNVNHH